MFLDGHKEILAEVLSSEPGLLRGWPGALRERSLVRAIQKGLAYPDLPCGRVEIPKQGDPIVRLRRPKLCSVASMLQLMSPSKHQYSELYQSHLGSLARVHAMAPTHRATTAAVAHEIVAQSLSLGLLFWRCFDPASTHPEERPKNGGFWLGILIHTLTDSYSDAHAVRVPGVPLSVAPAPDEVQERVMRHSALLYEIAGRSLDAPLSKKQLYAEIERVRRVKKRGVLHLAKQHQTYLLFVMHRQTFRAIRGDLPGVDLAIARGLERAATRDLGGDDIRAFSYYPTQPQPGYHALRDRLSVLRKRPRTWARMHRECAEFLRIFKDAAAQAAKSRTHDASARKRFLARLLAFLVAGPLRIAKGAAARPPMNYAVEDDSGVSWIAESLGVRGLV